MIFTRLFSSVLRVVAIGCLVGVVTIPSRAFARIIPGELAPGEFDLDVWQAEMAARHAALAKDGPLIPEHKRLRVEPTAEDLAKIGTEGCLECGEGGRGRLQIGVTKAVKSLHRYDSVSLLDLARGPVSTHGGVMRLDVDGSLVSTLALEAEKAGGLRAEIDNLHLPSGIGMYLYNEAGEAFGPYTGTGPMGDGHFWTNTIGGPVAYLEIRSAGPVTQTQLDKTRFQISGISYIDRDYFAPLGSDKAICGLDDCFEDATCYSETDWAPIANVRNAIAHMIFDDAGGTYICSGGLMADTDTSTTRNYFLSANHCFSNQEAASSLECFFRFKTTTCNSGCPASSGFPSTLGATLLSTGATSDYLFLELSQSPPAGSFYLGSRTDTAPAANGFQIYRISHPLGAAQHYNQLTVDTTWAACAGISRPSFIYSRDIVGATAGGSSGSPIMDSTGLVVGQQYGVCPNTIGDPNDFCDDVNNRIVDGAFSATYPNIRQFLDPVLNDDFDSPNILTGETGSTTANNADATKETDEPNHAGNVGGHSLWWNWSPPTGQYAKFDTIGSAITTPMGIYTGDTLGTLTTVVSSINGRPTAFLAHPDTTYRIAVDGINGTTGNITLNWKADTPPNDTFVLGTLISGASGTISDSNVGATKETNEPDHASNDGGKSIWYRWVAPSSGNFEFSTENSTFDTMMAVYTGGAVSVLTPVAENDDDPDLLDFTSKVSFQATQGTTYRIAIDGFNDSGTAESGFVVLTWSMGPPSPANDSFASAQVLSGDSGSVSGTNVGGSKETGEPDHAAGGGTRSVWYNWTPSVDGQASINTTGSAFDTVLAVYTGSTVNALSEVASNDQDGVNDTSAVTFAATGGTLYRVAVDGFEGASGAITLNYMLTPAGNDPGDVDGNGAITPADAELALECFLLGSCPAGGDATAADFCGGGNGTTPADAQGIFNAFLGLSNPCN
ncbi:MAG: lysyl endopeptidase [Candidatus Sumerlaeota bacterium]|nr:lysyl endopeptidase [Candidatus Sumerlaeota bacterium]